MLQAVNREALLLGWKKVQTPRGVVFDSVKHLQHGVWRSSAAGLRAETIP